MRRAPGRPRKYSSQCLVASLRALCKTLGRTPAQIELARHGYPDVSIYVARFGSWAAALAKVGRKPLGRGQNARRLTARGVPRKPVAAPPTSIRDYWLATDPRVQSIGWTHPYAKRRAS